MKRLRKISKDVEVNKRKDSTNVAQFRGQVVTFLETQSEPLDFATIARQMLPVSPSTVRNTLKALVAEGRIQLGYRMGQRAFSWGNPRHMKVFTWQSNQAKVPDNRGKT